jgi:hypothetical protein
MYNAHDMKRTIPLLISVCLLIQACGMQPIEINQTNIKSINCQPSDISSDSSYYIVREADRWPTLRENDGVIVYHGISMDKHSLESERIECLLLVFENEDSALENWRFFCSNKRDENKDTIAGDSSCSITYDNVFRQIVFVRGTVVLAVGYGGDRIQIDELARIVDGRLTGEIAISPTATP